MPRLSILIPSIAFDNQVEQTLVSVLQNRPEYSEVLVVTAEPYHDPYELGREVRFLTDAGSRTQVDLINAGSRTSRGDVIHLLLPGVRAVDGWTDHILGHFADPDVAAVAPLVTACVCCTQTLGAGVSYSRWGTRRVLAAGMDPNDPRVVRCAPLAPLLAAGFYRRRVMNALEGFDREFGAGLADVEFGLALQDLELKTVVEPRSRVASDQPVSSMPRTKAEACRAEQLFRRHPSHRTAQWGHAVMVAVEAAMDFPRLRMLARLWGRWSGRRTDSQTPYLHRLERARMALQVQHTSEVTTIRGVFGRPSGLPDRQRYAA